LVLTHQRADRLQRSFENAIQSDPFLLEVDSSGGDAGDFQQIIDESRQLPQLTFNDGTGFLLKLILVFLKT